MKRTLDTLCQQIAIGRQLTRTLNAALRGLELNGLELRESEFRLLWLLAGKAHHEADNIQEQCGLARQLGISPGQTSAIVEKLRRQQLILPITDEHDRRRQYWQLTTTGQERLTALAELIESRLQCETKSLADDANNHEVEQPPTLEDAA